MSERRRWPLGATVRMSVGVGFLTLALAAGVLQPGEQRIRLEAPTPVELIEQAIDARVGWDHV